MSDATTVAPEVSAQTVSESDGKKRKPRVPKIPFPVPDGGIYFGGDDLPEEKRGYAEGQEHWYPGDSPDNVASGGHPGHTKPVKSDFQEDEMFLWWLLRAYFPALIAKIVREYQPKIDKYKSKIATLEVELISGKQACEERDIKNRKQQKLLCSLLAQAKQLVEMSADDGDDAIEISEADVLDLLSDTFKTADEDDG